MKLNLDQYAHLDSVIHRWGQPSKIIALFGLIIAFSCVNQLILLPIMVLVTFVLYRLSRLPFSFWINRLRYPSLFILGLVFLLPIVAGDTIILDLGLFTIKQEGCLTVILIVTRFVCIFTISLVLFGTAPFLTTIQSLRYLHVSQIIVDMMLLSYRYLEELNKTLVTMSQAMQIRGFQVNKFKLRNLQILAGLMGSLLIRSYEQSQRVYQAMILRGYGMSKLPPKVNKSNDLVSKIASTITLIIAVSFILVEMIEQTRIHG